MSETTKQDVKLEIFDNGKNVRRENAVIVRVPAAQEGLRAQLDKACREAGAVHRWSSTTKDYAQLEISEADLRKAIGRMPGSKADLLALIENKSPPLPSLHVASR
jgi:hypothetical protein